MNCHITQLMAITQNASLIIVNSINIILTSTKFSFHMLLIFFICPEDTNSLIAIETTNTIFK